MSHQRAGILNTLIHRINSFSEGYRQNIAIIGEPLAGKTSLIKELLSSDQIKKDEVIPIYLEVKIEPFDFCAKRLIKSALFQLLKSDPALATPSETVFLIEDIGRNYPKTAQICMRVLQDTEKGRFEDAYSFMMDIPSVISEESKKRCILILDEFHNLHNFNLKHPFGTLARKIMIQKDTMYLLLSSKNTISQRLINEKLSMLFGNFEKIILAPFDLNMGRSFLKRRLSEVNLPQVYLDFIASFTGNKPFYLEALCNEIERSLFFEKISPEDHTSIVESAITEALFKKTSLINQYFFNLLFKISGGKLLSNSSAVLIALSSENKKQNDIAKSSKLQLRDVSKILNRLIEMDIIARNGSFYRFKDKLFCFWLKSVYLKRIMSFSIDESLEETQFKKEVANSLTLFVKEFEKELSSRIGDLFKLFRNDIIQLNGKKHKFISFDDVQKVVDGPSNTTNILALNGKNRWLCSIKKESVTENDITEIIKNIKKEKKVNRINRQIIVSLEGINENAYLMAKEAKFWVWDLESLNVLLELYGKPHIG